MTLQRAACHAKMIFVSGDQQMALLQVRGGTTVIVDDDDYEYLSQFKWRLTDDGYVCRASDFKRLHRLLLDPPRGLIVDHINRNPLDNRRCNLRLVTSSQSHANRGPGKHRKYKGVHKAGN